MNPLPVRFDKDGLVPVVIQDDTSGSVLMLAFMNQEALRLTRETGRTHFWSRSRQKLWKKGETSGHEQVVKSIRVNCYEDSLLIRVDQVGAACHTGYPTCYYRELGADNDLLERETRVFDPEAVYGDSTQSLAQTWLGAYRWLAEHDVTSVSNTSRLLRGSPVAELAARVSDELEELAGVLDGTHVHADPDKDLLLEASQSLYWLVVAAFRSGVPADRLRELVIAAVDPAPDARMNALAELRRIASNWKAESVPDLEALVAETIVIVSAAVAGGGKSLASVIGRDIDDLRSKPYLADYFKIQPA